jgi:hypothetical protein
MLLPGLIEAPSSKDVIPSLSRSISLAPCLTQRLTAENGKARKILARWQSGLETVSGYGQWTVHWSLRKARRERRHHFSAARPEGR